MRGRHYLMPVRDPVLSRFLVFSFPRSAWERPLRRSASRTGPAARGSSQSYDAELMKAYSPRRPWDRGWSLGVEVTLVPTLCVGTPASTLCVAHIKPNPSPPEPTLQSSYSSARSNIASAP